MSTTKVGSGLFFRSGRGGHGALAGMILFGWLLACDGDVTGPSDRRIGPAGGTAILADGAVRITVPPGALYEEIWFTITPALNVPTSDKHVQGSSWEIGPPGTNFAIPATLTIGYNPGSVPTGLGEEGLGVFKVAGSDWTLMANTSANPGSHTASGQVSTLGRFGVGGLAVASIGLAPASVILEPGQTAPFTASPKATDGRVLESRTVMWESSDLSVATVSDQGVVTGVAEGTATVTASCEGFEAEGSVLVSIPVASVAIEPASAVLNLGQTIQLSASVKGAAGTVLEGRTVAWASSDPAVASVDSNGLVSSKTVGSATITAQSEGFVGTATITVNSTLVVATIQLADGIEGEAYSQTLAAWGGNGSYQWSLQGGFLPNGLQLEPGTGEIKGTPSGSGTSTFTVRVESGGQTATKQVSILIVPIPVASVTVSPSSLSMTPGAVRQLTPTARDASGKIILGRTVLWATGDPAVATVTGEGAVTATGAGATTVTATIDGHPGWASVTVHDVLAVQDTTTDDGVVGDAYNYTLTASGGDGRYVWSVIAGTLPPGLTLHGSTGTISGTPTAGGTYSFIVEAASFDGQTATAGLAITVFGELIIETVALDEGAVSEPYSQILSAAGGQPPYVWVILTDTLPDGLTLDEETGVIEGIPTAEGTSNFTLRVTSADGQAATVDLSITIQAVPVASVELTPVTASAAIGGTQLFTAVPRDAGGNDLTGRTLVWSSSNQAVATVTQDGVATGVAVGSTTIIVSVGGVTDMANLTVYAPLSITTSSLADGTTGVAYEQTLAAMGGNGSYAWSITTGNLPDGLSLDGPTGTISGTPTATGTFTFTVRVDSDGRLATKILSITIG